jgi:hypothetical protein
MVTIASSLTTTITQLISLRMLGELKSGFSALEKFVQYRIKHGNVNQSLLPNFKEFLNNESFQHEEEYLRMLILFCRYFPS